MFKAEPVALAGDMATAQAFQHIVQNCVRQFRLNEALLLIGRDAEALHQTRVALRRLRSAFSIFRPMRSEEHTSELQSLMRISYAVFCLKKKQRTQPHR